MAVELTGKIVWWLHTAFAMEMWRREQEARLGSEDDRIMWENDKLLYVELLKDMQEQIDSVTLQGKIVRWLVPVVYREIQEGEFFASEFEEDAEDWPNDEPLYRSVLNRMLADCDMTVLDLEYEYGDVHGRKVVPDNPILSDNEAYAKMMAYWQAPEGSNHVRNTRPAEIVQHTGLNYDQVKRLLAEHYKKAMG